MNKAKRLGQHFLKDKKILEEMARAAGLTKKDVVLEVGPGTGTLTEVLAERAGKVIAVEKDRDLIPALREKFRDKKNVEIIEGDVLKISKSEIRNTKQILNSKFQFPNSHFQLPASHFKIVANIPYYITSRFLRLFLTQTRLRSRMMVLMIQREVAERICAKPPHMNLLALSVQAYAEPEIIRIVSRGAFLPPPKVDSAIIKIQAVKSPFGGLTAKFWNILRIAFQKKRKMLRKSIGKKIALPEKFKTKRPEELSLEDWILVLKSEN